MAAIFIAQGKERERTMQIGISGEKKRRRTTVSFLGADQRGSCAKVGVGILCPDEGRAYFWGVLEPTHSHHELIATWRAWKLLEQVWFVGETTLCACLASGHHTIPSHDKEYVDRLWLQFRGAFLERREEVLASLPTLKELIAMTETCAKHGITFSSREIVREYAKSGLAVPIHISQASHNEPPGNFWERCTQTVYHLFH